MPDEEQFEAQAVAVLEQIEKEVGLHDWGDKQSVIDSFVLFLKSVYHFASVNATAPDFIKLHIEDIKPHLIKRLKIQHEITLHPEILQIPIKAPLFIIGVGRNGSTMLQHLINADPNTRSPLLYEMVTPTKDDVFASRSADAWHAERIAAAQRYIEDRAAKCTQEYLDLHPMAALEPEECTQLTGSDFMLMEILSLTMYPRFYFMQSPERILKTIKFHKQAMQLLEFHRPSVHQHWTFKSPFYLPLIPAIRTVYPDAQFVFLHRDLSCIMQSLFALHYRMSAWYFSDKEAQKQWMTKRAKQIFDHFAGGLTRTGPLLEQLQKGENPPKIVHCQYIDLIADPAAEIERIYRELGREFTPTFKDKLQLKQREMIEKRVPRVPHEPVALTQEYMDETAKPYYEMFGVKR